MKKITLLLFGCFFLLISCNQSDLYHKIYTDFDTNRWLEKDTKTFEFTIDDTTKSYNINFIFSHVYDYQFKSVPIQIAITDPSGKDEKQSIDLQIKDDSGKQLADCSGDVCDLFYHLKGKTPLQKGNYKVVISHSFEGPYLPNVLGVGLSVSEVK
ncbi:MAG: hypothetical protein JNJ52_13590 [Flavobacterium sp.]|nr:hypothetical protein [Flavobacterium sp.]